MDRKWSWVVRLAATLGVVYYSGCFLAFISNVVGFATPIRSVLIVPTTTSLYDTRSFVLFAICFFLRAGIVFMLM